MVSYAGTPQHQGMMPGGPPGPLPPQYGQPGMPPNPGQLAGQMAGMNLGQPQMPQGFPVKPPGAPMMGGPAPPSMNNQWGNGTPQNAPMPPQPQYGAVPPRSTGPGPMPPTNAMIPPGPGMIRLPTNSMPSGAMPPQGAIPPGPMPPSSAMPPPGAMPPGPMPPSGAMPPPGAMPSGPMPPSGAMQPAGFTRPLQLPGSMPPGPMQPPNSMHQGHLPPGPMQPPSGMPPPGGMMPPNPMQPPSMGPQMGQMPPPQMGQMPPPQMGQMPPPPQMGQMPGGPPMYPGQAQQTMAPPRPGFPPQPGQMQQPGYPSAGPPGPMGMQQGPYPGAQPPQGRRLDPDQMPSPIQVMQEDQRTRSGPFYTNQRGQPPPLVTTDFITQDGGNVNPRLMRSSIYSVPVTTDMMKQASVPLALVISPLANLHPQEIPPPIIDTGEIGPVRCVRCKAYMCSFMQFVDGGRRFQCLLCKAASDVPPEYFQHLDHTGQRLDRYERPELMLGAYEFTATKEYCRNNTFPKPPAFVFVIDVSYNNIKSGMVQLLCAEMKNILRNLPRDYGHEKSCMRVGFITFNSAVHFYNIKSTLSQPKMMLVGDVNDMFMPLCDGFLADPSEAEELIDILMQQIPAMFAETRETDSILGPAIQAGLEALKAAECAGKLLIFHSSLPTSEAPGQLKNRDDRKLLGTDKEKTILSPQTQFYNNLGQDCVGAGCSVDLFLLHNAYIDVATLSQVCRLTGGQVYKYTYFRADNDGQRLIEDVTRNISRNIGFDAIMRVRTSTGVRPTEFHGHFFMANTTDMELASIDSDKAVALEIKHDDKLTEEDGVFIQAALLYTSCGGQRRLRILNLALKTCTQMADLYRGCDLDSVINFLAKQSVTRLLEHTPKSVKEALVNRCAQILACYRKSCASPSSSGQLVLPECMKLLPLYANCVNKSEAICGASEMLVDDRSYLMSTLTTMDIPSSIVYFYPQLLPLHEMQPGQDELPPAVRASSDKLRDDGYYLIENGLQMFLWIGGAVSKEWSHGVFGEHLLAQVDMNRHSLPELNNPASIQLRNAIEKVRSQRQRFMPLMLVLQRDKMEPLFKQLLVEDRGLNGSPSYVDFLCHMHKEIRGLLS